MILAVGDCVQFREEVQSTLDDLVQGQKEAQADVSRILDCPTVREAQQLLLVHQVRLQGSFQKGLVLICLKRLTSPSQHLLKRLKLKRKDVQQLICRGQQLQAEEGLGDALQQDLQSLENTLSKMEQNMDSQEQSLEVGKCGRR